MLKFESSVKIRTTRSLTELGSGLETAFKKVSKKVRTSNSGVISASNIEASFGSINRSDKTTVRVISSGSGYLITGETVYKPSFWFWVFVIIGLGTAIPLILALFFYMTQKSTVRTGVEKVFDRVKNEFDGES